MNKKTWAIIGVGVVTLISVYRTEKVVEDIDKQEKKAKKIVFKDLKQKKRKLGFKKLEKKREVSSVDVAAKKQKILNLRKKLWEKHNKQKRDLANQIKQYKIPVYNKRYIIEDGLYLVRKDDLEHLGHYEVFKEMGPYSIVETDHPPEGLKSTVVRDVKTLNLGYYTGEIKIEMHNINEAQNLIGQYSSVKIVNVFDHINTAIVSVEGLHNAEKFIGILKKDRRVKDANFDIVMANRRAH